MSAAGERAGGRHRSKPYPAYKDSRVEWLGRFRHIGGKAAKTPGRTKSLVATGRCRGLLRLQGRTGPPLRRTRARSRPRQGTFGGRAL